MTSTPTKRSPHFVETPRLWLIYQSMNLLRADRGGPYIYLDPHKVPKIMAFVPKTKRIWTIILGTLELQVHPNSTSILKRKTSKSPLASSNYCCCGPHADPESPSLSCRHDSRTAASSSTNAWSSQREAPQKPDHVAVSTNWKSFLWVSQ